MLLLHGFGIDDMAEENRQYKYIEQNNKKRNMSDKLLLAGQLLPCTAVLKPLLEVAPQQKLTCIG